MNTLYRYLRDYWVLVVVALFLAGVNQVFSMLDPAILQRIIDRYVTHVNDLTSAQFIRGVGVMLGLAVGAAFVSRVAKNFQDYYLNVITQQVGARIYADGIRHSLELPYADFEDQRSGETLGILQKVRTDVEKLISVGVNLFFITIVGVIFVMIYASTKNWLVGPVYLLTIPLIGALSSLLSKKIKTVQQVIVKETTALAGSTTESLRNIELVKSLGLAQQEIGRLNATTMKILKLELKKVRYLRSLSFIQGTFINFLRTSIQFMLMYLIFAHKLTLGDYMALWIYSFFIFGPLQELGNVVNTYREAEVSLQKFEAILAMKPEPRPANPISVSELDTLEFRDVGFQHNTASQPALQHISFSVTRGQTIAFVGPSGAGKTTLVKLLVGLYRPKTGHIHYNGIPEDEVDIDSLRGRIGFVTQDAQLFSGSIRENLLFVQPDATDEECLDVLRQASVQSLLARADRGLDTVIGEGGVKVSGGEKQRLSIARALLRKPQLLVFDEATSSLDSLTEEEISLTIRTVAESRDAVTILIAHRLSTVMHADCIYVLERGGIVESGRHEELVDRKGLYYAMWRQQVGESAPDQQRYVPVPARITIE
jgi:ATP-binding cassette subfamily B protein